MGREFGLIWLKGSSGGRGGTYVGSFAKQSEGAQLLGAENRGRQAKKRGEANFKMSPGDSPPKPSPAILSLLKFALNVPFATYS